MESIPLIPKNGLEELQSYINLSETAIQTEFETSTNAWADCFGSMVDVISMYLHLHKVSKNLSPEMLEMAIQRTEELKDEFYRLKSEYPKRENIPSEEIRQRLVKRLDVFASDWGNI